MCLLAYEQSERALFCCTNSVKAQGIVDNLAAANLTIYTQTELISFTSILLLQVTLQKCSQAIHLYIHIC